MAERGQGKILYEDFETKDLKGEEPRSRDQKGRIRAR